MSHDVPNPECPDCNKEITQDDQGRYVCGCGTFQYTCDNCSRPHNQPDASCRQCLDNACDKAD